MADAERWWNKNIFSIKAVHILLISTLLLLCSEDKTPLLLKSVQLNYMGVRICCTSCSTGIPLCVLISGSSHLLMLLQELTEPVFSHRCSLGSVKFDVFRSYTQSAESRARFKRLGQDGSSLRSLLKQETSAFLYKGKTLGNKKKRSAPVALSFPAKWRCLIQLVSTFLVSGTSHSVMNAITPRMPPFLATHVRSVS